MTVLERFLREAPERLAAKDHQAVLKSIERLAKSQAPGIRGRYLWGVALLAAAQAEKEDQPIKKYARGALDQFALVVRGNVEAGRDPKYWLRLEPSVELDCYYRIAEASRLLAAVATRALAAGNSGEASELTQEADFFTAEAERWAEHAHSTALEALSAGLTKDHFLPGSNRVEPGASRDTPITEAEFSDATMPVVRELDAAHERAARALQAIVTDDFAGREFATPAAQRAVVDRLRDLLVRLERRIECPVCTKPAVPRSTPGRTEQSGQIQYRHAAAEIRGSHGGGSTLPPLRLVQPPPDKRRK